ncbi:tetratricopeptide repeat protein [Streptomyces sp. NPDC006207]
MESGSGTRFGQILRELRQGRGLTLEELADSSGVSGRAIGDMERGRSLRPHRGTVAALARALQLDEAAHAELLAVARATRPSQETVPEVLETLARPAQLPAGLAAFAGRQAELVRLRDIAGEVTSTMPAASTTVLLSGMAGVGKTTLAVHWAHTVADRFPGGQFYVDLRGFDTARTAMNPVEALSGILEAWGLPPHRIPTGIDALAGLFRSLLVGRRVLVLLENASTTDQVRPLMPSSPGSLTLVTSRNTLPGLIATGARPLRLEPPSRTDAHAVLALRTGTERLSAEPEAANDIIEQCGRLPLALALVAARIQNNEDFALSAIAAELRSSQDNLDAFSGDGGATDARTAFACSYRLLSPDSARVFRLLSLHPGPDIAVRTAAALAALPMRTARTALGELANANLVMERAPGRYGLHDLLRLFATELTELTDTPAERRAAQHRMFDHYLHSAYAADQVLSSNVNPLRLARAQPDALPETFTSHSEALAWFTAERGALMAAVTEAMKTTFLTHAWQLPCCMHIFLDRQGHWQDIAASQRTGVDAARQDGDLLGEVTTLRKLARALTDLNQYEAAGSHLERAFEVAAELGDPAERAHTHSSMRWLLQRQERFGEARDHVAEALRLFRNIGLRSFEARNLNNIGWLHTKLGDYEEAAARSKEAICLTREIGDSFHEAAAWDTLASAHYGLGEFEAAIRCARRALDLLPEGGDAYNRAIIQERLGDAHAAVGDQNAAHTSWHRAADLFEQVERPEAEQVRAKLEASTAPPER